MSNRFPPARPLSMTALTLHGQRIVVAATHLDGVGASPSLLLQGGLWRVEISPYEARRVEAFVRAWWGPLRGGDSR